MIRDRRKAKGWSQEALAKALDSTQRQVTRWETFTTQLPRQLQRERLGEVLGIEPAEWHLAAAAALAMNPPNTTIQERSFLRQPLPRLLKALGAVPAEDEEIELDQMVSAGKGKPSSDRRKKSRLYLVEVEGDCMVPAIDNGDRVKFDPALAPEDGDWVVATIDGERAIVKGLEVHGAVQRLLPLNGEPLVIDENVRIVGVVLYHEKPGPRGRRRR